jgi:hypothetical protein
MSSRNRTRPTIFSVHVARLQQYLSIFLAIMVMCILTGCTSGNDDRSTLRGVVATGDPIVGATVTVKDADGATVSTTTDAKGAYEAEVTLLQAPYVLAATGGTVHGVANSRALHSVATDSGIANITPLTELLVASLVNADPASFFAALHTTDDLDTIVITEDNIATAQQAVVNLLKRLATPVDVSTVGNFITVVFKAKAGDPLDDQLSALRQALSDAQITLDTLSARLIDAAN